LEEERRHRLRELLGQARDPVVARTQLERIIEGNDLVGVNYLAIGMARARSVCRIQLRDAQRLVGYATGFLIGPGVLMTNHHVIGRAEDAQYSLAEFDYEYDIDGIDKPVACCRLLVDPPPITSQALDFALVAVAPRTVDGNVGSTSSGGCRSTARRGKPSSANT
jgi:endonuclease G, mitochondrial